jgi:hypothetical protein
VSLLLTDTRQTDRVNAPARAVQAIEHRWDSAGRRYAVRLGTAPTSELPLPEPMPRAQRLRQIQRQRRPRAAPLDPPPDHAPPQRRRQRKPSIATLLKQAEKAGRPVTSVTTPDGTTLTFGEGVADSPLDEWLKKKHARQT